MAGLSSRIRQFGLTPVYTSPDPQVDIVFVHGLNGHPYNTWATNPHNDKLPSVYWPSDLLPEVLASSRVRILTYGYNANVTAFTDSVSNDHIHHHAETLASSLVANRSLRNCLDRPIVFVCHSLGGLVVKRALIYCKNIQNERTEHLRSIWVSTYGILFLGTPHNGSDVAKWGLLLQNICTALMPKKLIDSSSTLIKSLKTNNETLQNINSLFSQDMGRFRIYYFHETLKTDVKGSRELIVDEASAAPHAEGVERMGIEADHRHMCKFDDDSSPGYEAVAEALLRYSRHAPETVAARWVEENKTRLLMKKAKASELFAPSEREELMRNTRDSTASVPLGPNNPSASAPTPGSHYLQITAPVSSAPPPNALSNAPSNALPPPNAPPTLLIAPPGFHPNATFYGMHKELEVLHTRLYKARKRPNRLMAVLISGVPGSGKSHLARQYVWTHREYYPGGIFWIDAKSTESIFKCFWDIAQEAMSTESPDFHLPDSNKSQKFVGVVRNWFQSREGWLIVFDGVSFSTEEDINTFRQFLPFKEKCSIIYTSVDKTLRKKQRLYEPYCLQISPLQVEDACKLLFKDLGIRSPTPQQIRKATELVKHYECLPLAVHAMGHHLSNISKPIEKYHIESHLTDKKLAEPFLSIMQDLYRMAHFEALNLINLLSFFDHHVPVGLINLGRAFLEQWGIEILTSGGPGEREDIDTTLGILIRYGLIERTSDAYALQGRTLSPRSEKESILDVKAVAPDLSESQTESSQDAFFSIYNNSGSIDMIKVHSVVQGFCRDELKIMDDEMPKSSDDSAAGYYHSWLVVATRVFCISYANAKQRMVHCDDYGLVKDYREYETHASRLSSLFPKRTPHESATVRQAREELRQVRRDISNEIERLSPSSSQESIRRHRSVFDRSSSSSSSLPESATDDGPSRQLTWDLNEITPRVESPQEMPKPPHNFNLRPFLPHIFRETGTEKEIGYETDGESEKTFPRISPIPSHTSNTTERPKSSQASSPHQADDQGWHVVEKPKPKTNKENPGKQRSKFPRNIRRPRLAAPVLKVETAEGRSASSSILERQSRRGSLSASEALIAVHNASPPQSQGDFAKMAAGRPSLAKENIPTYATVAARSVQDTDSLWKPRSTSTPAGLPRPTNLGLSTRSSGDSLLTRSVNMHASPFSPENNPDRLSHSTYSEPERAYITQDLNALDLRTSIGSRYHTRHMSTMQRIAPTIDLSASTPSVATYLPPLPYDGNIEVTYGHNRTTAGLPKPATLSHSTTNISAVSHPSAIMPGVSRPPSVTAEPPMAYASDPAPEPMSRGPSGQSHHSWSTEPARIPPRISPMPSTTQAPVAPVAPGPPIMPQQQVLSGTGSWATPHAHQQQIATAFQTDVTYASAHLRANPIDPRLDPGPTVQGLGYGAHPLVYRPYEAAFPQALVPPYHMYHSNLSGPIISPEAPLYGSQELHPMRPRSGSSPPRSRFNPNL